MDKEEAMKILKDFHDRSAIFSVRTALETLHPELAESEDEKIRKVLVDYFKRYKEQEECGINTFYGIATDNILAWLEKRCTVIKDTISMDVNSETEWDDIHKFLRMNLDGEKVKLLIIREE